MIIKNKNIEFKKVKLKDVLTIKNGKSQKSVEAENGIYGIYGTGGLMGHTNSYIAKENSIIIGRKGTIDKPLFVKEKYWLIDTAFYTDNFSYDSKYLYYLIKKINFNKYSKSAVIPSLTKNDLNEIEILVAKDSDYATKIRIYLDNQHDRLDKIKKLLVNIKLRNQYYSEKVLDGELSIDNNEKVSKFKLNPKSFKIEEIISDLPKSKLDAKAGSNKGEYRFFKSSAETYWSDNFIYDIEAIIMADGGKANVEYYNGKFSTSNHVYVFNSPVLNNKYFYYLLKSKIHLIDNCFQGAALKNLSKKQFKQLELNIFEDIDYQNKIVKFLDGLNDEKEKIEKLLKLEEQRFEWLSDKLLSGEYIIED